MDKLTAQKKAAFESEVLDNWGTSFHSFAGFEYQSSGWQYNDFDVNGIWLSWSAGWDKSADTHPSGSGEVVAAQVMACHLNSVGRALPDHAPLYANHSDLVPDGWKNDVLSAPALKPRRPASDEPDVLTEYEESDRDWFENNAKLVEILLSNAENIRRTMATAPQPSASVTPNTAINLCDWLYRAGYVTAQKARDYGPREHEAWRACYDVMTTEPQPEDKG